MLAVAAGEERNGDGVDSWQGHAFGQHAEDVAHGLVRSSSDQPQLPQEDSTDATVPSPELLEAANRYLFVLQRAGQSLDTVEQDVLRRHVAHLSLILPENILAEILHQDPGVAATRWTFKEGAGARLLTWWRRQDPIPATLYNERLLEHLRRVRYAEAQFPDAHDALGLDDRGRTYIRYGEPGQRREVRFDEGGFVKEVVGRGVHISMRDFPRNEFWFYPRMDRFVYFLFLEEGTGYRLGSSDDLIPPLLRNRLTATRRDLNIAVTALAALRHIYAELAMLHPDFAARYASVESYVLWQEQQQIAAEMGVPSETVEGVRVGVGFGEERIVFAEPTMGIEYPNDFVYDVIEQSRHEDVQLAYRRAQVLPHVYFDPLKEMEQELKIAVRTARFLDEGGTTRTELYWSPLPGALDLTEEQANVLNALPNLAGRYLLRTTVAQQDLVYRTRVVNVSHTVTTADPYVARTRVPVRTAVAKGDTGLYNLSVQWDQIAGLTVAGAPDSLGLGPRLKLATLRLDSLRALSPEPDVLEMSDVQPVLVPRGADVAAIDFLSEQARTSYPFTHIPSDAQLVLYFEIYHLTPDAGGRTQYSIAYELDRKVAQSGLRGLFGKKGGEATEAKSTYTGTGRTAREYVLLDLNEFEGAGDLRITLRVADEATGRHVARSIGFTTVGP